MRAVLQRVTSASVTVDGEVVGRLEEPGLVVLLGVTHDDGPEQVAWMVRKIRDLEDHARGALGRRPRRSGAGDQPVHAVRRRPQGSPSHLAGRRPGQVSEPLYEAVCAGLEELGTHVERGVFGADMTVELANDGPVTMILET